MLDKAHKGDESLPKNKFLTIKVQSQIYNGRQAIAVFFNDVTIKTQRRLQKKLEAEKRQE